MTEREAIKLALVTFEEINKLSVGENAICLPAEIDTAMDACREALAQQKQEPVAYDKTELNCFAQDLYNQKMLEGKRGHYESMFHVIHQCIRKVAPPHRKPLTDEEIDVVYSGATGQSLRPQDKPLAYKFARAVETKLQERT